MSAPDLIRGAKRPLAIMAGTLVASMFALPAAEASSHREAPFITTSPKVDGTDFYMFRSYEPNRAAFTTVVADYQPLQNPGDGPNYYTMDQDALYEIHLAKDGHATEDLTFQFRFTNTLKDITLPIGGKNVSIPLVQAGGISGQNPPNLNVRETYAVTMVTGDRRTGTRAAVTNATDGTSTFEKPVDNIGDKTFGSTTGYAAYAQAHTYNITVPNCATPGRMFVGQRKDPFALALGQVFDLINLNPLATTQTNRDYLAQKNVTSLILELPTACIVGTSPIIGGWTTASMRQGRLLSGNPASGYSNVPKNGGAWVQVSRLGMPLVNEVVIGLKDKDKFNSSKPSNDGTNFADYVTNPTFPALVQLLFPSAPAPTNFPRTDLVAAFLTGITGVNKPANVVASEMLRLNTSVAPTPIGSQNTLGVLGGDNAGFPNGRRPGDDVVDVTLRVAMGALCVATGTTDALGVGCKPSDAPAGAAALTDGVPQNASMFLNAFPYLNTPISGSP